MTDGFLYTGSRHELKPLQMKGPNYLYAGLFTIKAASSRFTVSLSSSFPDLSVLGFPGALGRRRLFCVVGREGVIAGAGTP